MNGRALLGLLLILYAIAVGAIAIKKPGSIWEMGKTRLSRNSNPSKSWLSRPCI